jgi:hypothetical protein
MPAAIAMKFDPSRKQMKTRHLEAQNPQRDHLAWY